MSDPPVPETVPVEFGGKWLAWSQDALRIVGVGDSPDEVRKIAAQQGEQEIVCEWVPLPTERFIGSL